MAEPEKVQRTLLLSMGSSIKDGRWQSGEEWLGCYGWAFDFLGAYGWAFTYLGVYG